MSGTRSECVFMARLAEQAERYEDMVEYMKRVVSMGSELSADERNLLSVAYKNSVGARRTAWRAICTSEQREAAKGPAAVDLIKNYRMSVEKELNAKCNEILQMISQDLVVKASTSEAKVFLLKMKGDYHRYLAEFSSGEEHSKAAQDAHDSYQTASETAVADLTPTHPIRLGLALNFSVFYFEVLSSTEKACNLAQTALNDAVNGMGQETDEEAARDAQQIMHLLSDNLKLWTSDMAGADDAHKQDGTTVEDF